MRDRERKKRDGKGALPALFSTIRCLKATSRVDIPTLFEYQLFSILSHSSVLNSEMWPGGDRITQLIKSIVRPSHSNCSILDPPSGSEFLSRMFPLLLPLLIDILSRSRGMAHSVHLHSWSTHTRCYSPFTRSSSMCIFVSSFPCRHQMISRHLLCMPRMSHILVTRE